MKRFLRAAGGIVIWAYCISVVFAVPYFNWSYANQHGFWGWVAFGEVIATAKAAIWPYYLFADSVFGGTQPARATARTLQDFRDSIIAAQLAFSKQSDVPAGAISRERLGEIVYYHKVALEHAEKVNARELQFIHSEAPKRFTEDYLAGLRLYCRGADTEDLGKMNQGTLRINSWGNWYRAIQSSQ